MSRKGSNTKATPLFDEFPPKTRGEWKSLIERDLGGAHYERLLWRTYEDFSVEPFYTAEDAKGLDYLKTLPGEFPYTRGTEPIRSQWLMSEDISAVTVAEANRLALGGLKRGLSSLTFLCEVSPAKIKGIPLSTQADMAALLKDVPIEKVPVNFRCGGAPLPILALFVNEAQRRGVPLERLGGSLLADPIGALVLEGTFPKGRLDTFTELKRAIEFVDSHMPRFRCVSVGSAPFHNSGASLVQELAFALAGGVDYLSELTSMGLVVDQVAGRMAFNFSIGSTYFMEIAKLRAARTLWAKIVEQYNPKEESSLKMYIHASTSMWNKTLFDPYVNTLRATTEAMSAAIGGADLITLSPFDATFRSPDHFSRRLARNTQLILKNECYLDAVRDPGAGSYYIEQLTDKIAHRAWEIFLSVEERGGLTEALKSGYVQEEIEKVRGKRDKNTAARKDVILGTNHYPNLGERMGGEIKPAENEFPLEGAAREKEVVGTEELESMMEMLLREGASIGDFVPKAPEHKMEIMPLRPYRAAQAFEGIRLKTEAHAERTGKVPRVFLLPMGDPGMRNARANFSLNFFGCAGFEVIDNLGFSTAEEGADAALASDAQVVVICSSDGEYPELAPEVCRKLRERSEEAYIVVAGCPKEENARKLKEAGVDDFIFAGIDAADTLRRYQTLLGITKEAREEIAR